MQLFTKICLIKAQSWRDRAHSETRAHLLRSATVVFKTITICTHIYIYIYIYIHTEVNNGNKSDSMKKIEKQINQKVMNLL